VGDDKGCHIYQRYKTTTEGRRIRFEKRTGNSGSDLRVLGATAGQQQIIMADEEEPPRKRYRVSGVVGSALSSLTQRGSVLHATV
jgi:hypothetical protein